MIFSRTSFLWLFAIPAFAEVFDPSNPMTTLPAVLVPRQAAASTSAPPAAPGLTVTTVVSGSTFTVTYVSTNAPGATSIAEPSTTIAISSGGPIWIVPIVPIGWPVGPPPPPPPEDPIPGPEPEPPTDPKCTSATYEACTVSCSVDIYVTSNKAFPSTVCPTNSRSCATSTTCSPAPSVKDSTTTVPQATISPDSDDGSGDGDNFPDYPETVQDGTKAVDPDSQADDVKYQRVPFTACGGDEKSAVGVETNFFSALAGQFCKSDLSKPQKRNLTNHDIPSMKRGLLGRTPPPTNKGWEGWNFEFDWIPGAPNCAGDCVGVFNDAVAKCSASDLHAMIPSGKHGLDVDCGGVYKWNIYPAVSVPPPVPTATCSPAATAHARKAKREVSTPPSIEKRDDLLASQIKDFCSTNKLKTTGNTDPAISKRYTPPTSKDPQIDTTISLSWKNDACPGGTVILVEDNCNDILSKINSCDVGTGGDVIQNECVHWAITRKPYVPPDEINCGGASYQPPYVTTTFTHDQGIDAINQFCSSDKIVIDPSKTSPAGSGGFSQFGDDTFPDQVYRYPPNTADTVVEIKVSYYQKPPMTVPGQLENCKASQKFKVKDYQDRCKFLLGSAVDGCDTATRDKKNGGTTLETEGEHGCVNWSIYAYSVPAS